MKSAIKVVIAITFTAITHSLSLPLHVKHLLMNYNGYTSDIPANVVKYKKASQKHRQYLIHGHVLKMGDEK